MTLFKDYKFPVDGWKRAGSNSMGSHELYNGLSSVIVKTFPSESVEQAYGTLHFLIEHEIDGYIKKIKHVDNNEFYYVFMSESAFSAAREKLFSNVFVAG